MTLETFQYIRRIRNDRKRAYAERFAQFVDGKGPEPDYADLPLSYMAAQAVRSNIWNFARKQEQAQ